MRDQGVKPAERNGQAEHGQWRVGRLAAIPARLNPVEVLVWHTEIPHESVDFTDARLEPFAADIRRAATDSDFVGRVLTWPDGCMGFASHDVGGMWAAVMAPLRAYERARAELERQALLAVDTPAAGAH